MLPRTRRRARPHAGAGKVAVGLLLLSAAGCSPAILPRTADTVPEGEIGGGAHLILWSFGTGRVERPDGSALRESTGGADFRLEDSGAADVLGPLLGYGEYNLRYGVTRWAEVGVQAGSHRLGGELRFAALDEDVGDSFSMALAGGFYYSAIADGPWGRAGVDVSTRLGAVAPLLNVYVSHGATYHSATVDLPGDDDCPEEAPWQECGVLYGASSMETRLSVAVGLAWALGEEAALSFGAVPHVVLHATRPVPEEGSPEIVHHDAGLHLVFGVQAPGW